VSRKNPEAAAAHANAKAISRQHAYTNSGHLNRDQRASLAADLKQAVDTARRLERDR